MVLTQPRTLVSFQGMLIHSFIWFLETLDFPIFSISRKLWSSDVFHFWKLWNLMFSNMFDILHLSPVTSSTVSSTSHFLDSAVSPCHTLLFSLMYSGPLLCTQYNPLPFVFIASKSELRLLLSPSHPFLVSLYLLSLHLFLETPEILESRIPTLPHTWKSKIPEGFHREQGNTLSLPW